MCAITHSLQYISRTNYGGRLGFLQQWCENRGQVITHLRFVDDITMICSNEGNLRQLTSLLDIHQGNMILK